MKILLLGEFSALHKNLKEGLQELGHDAVIASTGDGWKNIPRDIDLDLSRFFFHNKLTDRIYPWFELSKLYGYDVVQLISPFLFYRKYFLNKLYIKKIIDNNKKLFVSGAGSDAYFWKYGRERLEYGPFEDFLKYDKKAISSYLEDEKLFNLNKEIVDLSDGIIPIMYEYEISYKGHEKLKETIPIPMNLSKIKYEENVVKNKLVVFHGLNRYGFKGTRHVEEAFDILSKRYPNELELVIDGNMPLDKYLEVMKKTNIIIDQTNGYSLGVNGVYALAMGKIVLGGAEPESLTSLNITNSPVINIKPNAQSIVTEIEKLLDNKANIPNLGYQSRIFVEKVHCHIKVAKQYLKIWEKNI